MQTPQNPIKQQKCASIRNALLILIVLGVIIEFRQDFYKQKNEQI